MTGKQTKKGYKIIWVWEKTKPGIAKIAKKRNEDVTEMMHKLSTGELVLVAKDVYHKYIPVTSKQ